MVVWVTPRPQRSSHMQPPRLQASSAAPPPPPPPRTTFFPPQREKKSFRDCELVLCRVNTLQWLSQSFNSSWANESLAASGRWSSLFENWSSCRAESRAVWLANYTYINAASRFLCNIAYNWISSRSARSWQVYFCVLSSVFALPLRARARGARSALTVLPPRGSAAVSPRALVWWRYTKCLDYTHFGILTSFIIHLRLRGQFIIKIFWQLLIFFLYF